VDKTQKASRDKKFSSGGKGGMKKMSDYGKHLREKQIARLMAQVTEAQFKRFFVKASKDKGKTGEALLRFLEVRLDNITRRLGFAISMKASRQLVNHGHVLVNGRHVDIPSFLVKPGDTVNVDAKAVQSAAVKLGLENADKSAPRPSFLSWDPATMTGKMVRWPDRGEVSINVDEQLIVEFYSK
jgi:small subunit ribosomal protein S4